MRTGLLGGSFNPIHNAHLCIAAEARDSLGLDRIIFIPAADPPHKLLAGDVSFERRSYMVGMAIGGIHGFDMSLVEAEREGKSYSIDTIKIFRELSPNDDLFFIVGGDSFREIGTWHRYDEIFSSCSMVVVERPGFDAPNPLDVLPEKIRGKFTFDVASGALAHQSGTQVFFITGRPQELSSSEIRRLAATGADIRRYVPPEVAAYISQQRIYYQCQ